VCYYDIKQKVKSAYAQTDHATHKARKECAFLRELDKAAVEAAADEQKLNDFIARHRKHILICASKTVRRYITESDDEWSLALFAFTQAIQSYDLSKGSFLHFADMVIRRRLADYFKSQSRFAAEIPVSPHIFDAEPEEDDEDLSIKLSVAEKVSAEDERTLSDEIEAISQTLKLYGFSFFDLTSCSPKAAKTKAACADAVTYILRTPMLLEELKASRQLPIKNIEINRKIPRKILERHRKYIIAAAEILSGDYPCLAEYMQSIRKELNGA
jgi:RNA polymerase sigma factor